MILSASACFAASGLQSQTLAPSGYLGSLNLPSARTVAAGSAWFSVANNNPEFSDPYGDGAFGSANLGLGLLPGIEVVGRLSFAGDPHCSMYSRTCRAGPRDLSLSAKGSLPVPALEETWIAFGVTDYGGAATRYRGQYLVATRDLGVLDVSAGYGRASSPLALTRGAFGSVQVRATPHWSGVVEASTYQGQRLGVLGQHRIVGNWSGHVALSYGFNQPPGRQASQIGLGIQWSPAQSNPIVRASAPNEGSDRNLQLHSIPLVVALETIGFSVADLQSGRLRVDFTRHRSDRTGALRRLLSLLAQHPSSKDRDWQIELSLWGRTVQAFSVRRACLAHTTQGSLSCVEPLRVATEHSAFGSIRLGSLAPQIELGLGLRSAVGTEYGLFDYSAAAEVGWESELVSGLVWQGYGSVPLGKSDDFAAERAFAADRHWRAQVEQNLVSFWLPLAGPTKEIHLQAMAGQMSLGWTGQQFDALWLSESGRWRVFATLGHYQHVDGLKRDTQQAVASVRYSVLPGRWHLDLQAGRYFGSDEGIRLSSVHWAGPLRAALYLLRSGNSARWDLPTRSFAGFEISFPLDFLSTGWSGVSIRGRDRWTYRLETKVGEEDNIITRGYGRVQSPRHGLLTSVTDFDRSGRADTRARLVQSTALH